MGKKGLTLSTENKLNNLCELVAKAAKLYYNPRGDEETPLEDWDYDNKKDIIIENWDKLNPKWQEYYESPEALKSTSYYTIYKELPKI